VPAFAWVGAAAAALVASVFIMLKGGMVERPQRERAYGPMGAGGSPDGSGIPELGADDDPFKRFLTRDRGGAPEGPAPTQTETQMLSNGDGWSSPDSEPAWSFASPGDGGRAPIPNTPEWFTGGYAEQYNTAGAYQPPPSGGLSSAPNTPSYFGAPSNAPSSPVPVATADPSVYRVPGTNIKLT
jgi:hypothetical protein